MSATCPPSIARVHRSLASTLVDIMCYINQLEGISTLSDNTVGKAKYCRILLVIIIILLTLHLSVNIM